MTRFRASLIASSLIFAVNTTVSAAPIKVGVLSPETTNWAKHLKAMVTEIKKATDNRVQFKIYFNGSMGDEDEVLKKIRLGQLDGGIFTGKTLGELNGDIRVMELPFTFHSDRQKAYETLQSMAEFFNEKLAKGKGRDQFQNLGFFEIGQIYFISQKKSDSLEKLKGLKIWSWKGDPIVSSMIESMNLVSVPLALPDVLSSLSTNIVEAAYAPPVGILALQWHTKTKYVVNFPISYSVGAFLVSASNWKKMTPADQEAVARIAKASLEKISKANVKDNEVSLTTLKNVGLEMLEFPKSDIDKSMTVRGKIIDKLRGKVISQEALDLLDKNLKK